MKQIFPDKNLCVCLDFQAHYMHVFRLLKYSNGQTIQRFFLYSTFLEQNELHGIKDYNYCTVTNVMLRNGVINHSVTNIFSATV